MVSAPGSELASFFPKEASEWTGARRGGGRCFEGCGESPGARVGLRGGAGVLAGREALAVVRGPMASTLGVEGGESGVAGVLGVV